MSIITEQASILGELVEDILVIPRLDADRLRLWPEVFDLSNLVHEAVTAAFPDPGGTVTSADGKKTSKADISVPGGVLAYGDLKRVELAVALANKPRLLLMDEPTAGMGPAERQNLMELTKEIVRTRNIGVLFTEHDMDVVFNHADRIIVLNRGELVAEGTPEEVQKHPEVLKAYLGAQGIGTEVYYPIPMHLQACFAGLGGQAGDFPVSEQAANQTLALPIYPELSHDQQAYVVEQIGAFLNT